MTPAIPYLLLVPIWLLSSPARSAPMSTPVQDPTQPLCGRIEQIRQTEQLVIAGDGVSAVHLIPELYKRLGYTLAWQKQNNVLELLAMIEASREEGLKPEDYHRTALRGMRERYLTNALSDCERADFDILLSDALLRLGYHYVFGKVNPHRLDPHWNLQRQIGGRDPVEAMLAAIDAASLAAFLHDLTPTSPLYEAMKAKLAEYRAIAASGGWPEVPAGPALKPGMSDARVPLLRDRLAVTGDLDGAADLTSTLFDDQLEQAVLRFQKRHVLDADGIVGKATLAALNVPVTRRIDQIRVNLERARWVYRNLPDEFIVADIAGFQVSIRKNHEATWESPVQVGKPYRQTPVFKDTMKHIVFNPTWTVPPTILREDLLPRIKRDPSYLAKHHLRLLDTKGRTIDPDNVDWKKITTRNFPYRIRQDPGPHNALGRVKFMFPNEHAVYLHDTPHQSGFNRANRAFSSGCIRVQRPFELAERLLNDPDNWSREQIEKVIESRKTTTVRLNKPLPIYLLYWTVASEAGVFYFKPDIYARDAKVLEALDGRFQLDAPDNMPDWYRDRTLETNDRAHNGHTRRQDVG